MKKETFIALCTGDLKEESCWGIASFKTLYNYYADCSDAEWEKIYNGMQFNAILWNITNHYKDLFCVLMSENCIATLKYDGIENADEHITEHMVTVVVDIFDNQLYGTKQMIAHIGKRKCDKLVLGGLLIDLSTYMMCECAQLLAASHQASWRKLAHSIMYPSSWGEYFVSLIVGHDKNQSFHCPLADDCKGLVDFWSTKELLSSIAEIPFYETKTASEILIDLTDNTRRVVLLWIKEHASLYCPIFERMWETSCAQNTHTALHKIFSLNNEPILNKKYYTISWVQSVIRHIDEIDDEGNL